MAKPFQSAYHIHKQCIVHRIVPGTTKLWKNFPLLQNDSPLLLTKNYDINAFAVINQVQ